MEAPLRGGAPGPLNEEVMLSHWSGGVGVLVEIADQTGSEKLTEVKTKSQGWLRVTICLRKKGGRETESPPAGRCGGDKEVAGKVRNNGRAVTSPRFHWA
jgi:hypothetical protein